MKRKITLLFLALAGTLSAGSVPFTLSRNGSWKPDESGKVFTRTVREGQTEWSQVLASAKLAADSYYCFSWRVTSSKPDSGDVLILVADGPKGARFSRYNNFVPSSEIQKFYLYTDRYAGDYTFSIRTGMKNAQTLVCKDISLEKLDPADLENELLPDSPEFFFHPRKDGWMPARFTADNSSPMGRSITFSPAAFPLLRTVYVPMIPGKTYRMELWMKAAEPLRTCIRLDTYMGPFAGKHEYKDLNVLMPKTWKKFSLEWTVPADTAAAPMLLSGMMRISATFESKDTTASIAGVSLKMVK